MYAIRSPTNRLSFLILKFLCYITESVNYLRFSIFQLMIFIVVIHKYIVHLLLAYYFEKSYIFLDASIFICEIIFFIDVFIQLLHTFWPILRLHVRVYRRNYILLTYDVVSLVPLSVICKYIFITILRINV